MKISTWLVGMALERPLLLRTCPVIETQTVLCFYQEHISSVSSSTRIGDQYWKSTFIFCWLELNISSLDQYVFLNLSNMKVLRLLVSQGHRRIQGGHGAMPLQGSESTACPHPPKNGKF